MSDTYQAVFDAVRSRISNGDIGEAVEAAMRDANIPHYVERAFAEVGYQASCVASASTAPHVLMRPRVFKDGNQWCALYGENIQEGVCGFGDTPEKACASFDDAWKEPR